MKKVNESVFDVIEEFDYVAQVAALKGVAHASMVRTILYIRRDIKERITRDIHIDDVKFKITHDEKDVDLNFRTKCDEFDRSEEEIKGNLGFKIEDKPLLKASKLHAVYIHAVSELKNIRRSEWDDPLTVDQMLDFMSKHTPRLSQSILKALAEVTGLDKATLSQMDEIQAMKEQEKLREEIPEIIASFIGFGEIGNDYSIGEIDCIDHLNIGIKTLESVNKAIQRTMEYILKSRSMRRLGDIPILKDAANKLYDWALKFEESHSMAIDEALEAGRSVKSVSDVKML